MPAWLTSWRATRTSISVAASRGFREPRRGFPYRRRAESSFAEGIPRHGSGEFEERKRKIEGIKERWKKRVGRKGRTLVTAKLLSIHGRHAPNWEYAPRSCSTRTDAAWTCWTGAELIFRNRSCFFFSRAVVINHYRACVDLSVYRIYKQRCIRHLSIEIILSIELYVVSIRNVIELHAHV